MSTAEHLPEELIFVICTTVQIGRALGFNVKEVINDDTRDLFEGFKIPKGCLDWMIETIEEKPCSDLPTMAVVFSKQTASSREAVKLLMSDIIVRKTSKAYERLVEFGEIKGENLGEEYRKLKDEFLKLQEAGKRLKDLSIMTSFLL